MVRGFLNTIEDLEKYYYGISSSGKYLAKADAPHLTSTTGVENDVYGRFVWVQQNLEANAFGALPKQPWVQDGWRVTTATAAGTSVAENATIPDTVKHTFLEVSTNPKTHVLGFDVSEHLQLKVTQTQNDNIGSLEQMRASYGETHAEDMNQALLGDVDTVAGNDFESIDRVCSSNSEVTNLSLDANDADIYGIDRDAGAGWSDAVVNDNSGTDRDLTDDLIRNLIQQARSAGGKPQFWLGHHDTKEKADGIYQDAVRYQPVKIRGSVNGISTAEGAEFGVETSNMYGFPFIASSDVFKDTIGRLYLLDTTIAPGAPEPRLHMAILQPTRYAESGTQAADQSPFAIDRFGNEALYWTTGELRCKFFAGQAKLRDLK